jgi:glycine dehydrogenase subunit 1
MSLMGPAGMKELGETILEKSHYAAGIMEEINGVSVPYSGFFKEFPVKFNKDVDMINKKLLKHKIFGGENLSKEYPELGNSALYCVTETHSLEMIDSLAKALREVLA